jgi:hypothetical protein
MKKQGRIESQYKTYCGLSYIFIEMKLELGNNVELRTGLFFAQVSSAHLKIKDFRNSNSN